MKRLIAATKTQLALLLASLFVLGVDVGLRVGGYRRTSRVLVALSPKPDIRIENTRLAYHTARFIDRAAARVNASCLRRSLTLWWWLRWKGLPSTIIFGMNATGGHAWVEHHAYVINDHRDIASAYTVVNDARMSPEEMARL